MIDVVLNIVLLLFLLTMAVSILFIRHLMAMAMLFGLYSLLTAALFLVLDAPDVAFTEAAVGTGISTVLMLATLAITGIHKEKRPKIHLPALLLCTLVGGLLVVISLDLPPLGDEQSPALQGVAKHYLEKGKEETGVPNVVTAVLASYRGFDTLGEVAVIFTGGVCVLMLLGHWRQKPSVKVKNKIRITSR
ncbi:DUF4040 domain-containing protein [Aliiglaciecola sp. CAU 1673]|uniref:DUF4040 domain-containing protein n=1 Tax=Aliiglaciecola sp. CAU 1673 TaxID=3032595 RepID=UPI0023DAE38D|nr:DUF4040 domain-containing protein [Aliiglaciecola sp. CAU 1673]MDF2179842.1 DUF4040 domain-containing protein [Aliiglaciecola sp. CAU 1673]